MSRQLSKIRDTPATPTTSMLSGLWQALPTPGYKLLWSCRHWILQLFLIKHLFKTHFFSRVSLESSWRCRADYIELLDGVYGEPNWNKTATICRRRRYRSTNNVYYSSSNLMKIRFVTDGSTSRRGFRLRVIAGLLLATHNKEGDKCAQ